MMTTDQAPHFALKMARELDAQIFVWNLPGRKRYLVADYKLAREILQDKLTERPRELYKNFQATGSKTLFTSGNDAYAKSLRKSVLHAFSRNEVMRMNDVAAKYVDEWMTTTLQEYSEQDTVFDPAHEFNLVTFKVICEAAFEYDATSLEEFNNFGYHSEIAHREFVMKRSMNPLRKYIAVVIPSARKANHSSEVLLAFAKRVLEAYRQKPNKSDKNTIIKILEANKSIVDDHQKISEIKDWLTAGHDTTGYSLANISTLLAKNPDVQTKLRQELLTTKALGEKLERCNYFQCVIKEGMRMIPVAAGGGARVTGRDFLRDDGTVIIPKGAACGMHHFVANRNEAIYKDADSFVPERWINPSQEMKDAFSYVPFNAGTRACPGQALAMAEINSSLPRLLLKFRLELVEEGKLSSFLTFKYTGTRLRVKEIVSNPE